MKVSYMTLMDYDLIHLEQKVNQMTQLGWRLHSSYGTASLSLRHVVWLVKEELEEEK